MLRRVRAEPSRRPARWRGDAGSSPLDGASAATSAPDSLVDCHTGQELVKAYNFQPVPADVLEMAQKSIGMMKTDDEEEWTFVPRAASSFYGSLRPIGATVARQIEGCAFESRIGH